MAVIETLTVMEKETKLVDNEISVIIMLEKKFGEFMKSYDLKIWGKKMWEWVALSCDGYMIKTIPCTPESDVLTLIKPLLTDSKYTVVLYSDTPLFKRQTLNEIMTYVRQRDLNVLPLRRGYVFNTDYIRNADSIRVLVQEDFGTDDFTVVEDYAGLAKVSKILKNRIINFHLSNGVQINDTLSTFIDADVMIEKGTVLEPNTYIKGASFIGKNCKIEFGSVIENSIISDECIIKCSYISESRISVKTVVGPYESVVAKSS